MTPKEFKAWFEGFTEAFTGCPTKVQWARIKDRVGEIDGNSVTEKVFIDRYWPSYQRHWLYASNTVPCTANANLNGTSLQGHGSADCYNSLTAMTALGRSEAQSIL